MPGGRPTVITKAMAAKVFARMAEGESLRKICVDKEMPGRSTILRAATSTTEDLKWFRDQYAEALALRAHTLADELFDIADDGSNDWMERAGRDGDTEVVANTEHINRARLRVDTRKWALSKMLPKLYGDKQVVEHTGKDGAPLVPVINVGSKKD